MSDLRFTEIEHKYVVDADFDLARFRVAVAVLGPVRVNEIRVRDRYYLTEGAAAGRYLIRHRFDAELQQLTVKALEPDSEMREEVNLDLGSSGRDQAAEVGAFLARLGVRWTGTVSKALQVWYFDDCEVVYYEAASPSRTIRCVEFEATRKDSVAEALAIVRRFEGATGFSGRVRERRSLPQLLFPELSEHLSGGAKP